MNVTTFGSRENPPVRRIHLTPADVEAALRRYIVEERPEFLTGNVPFQLECQTPILEEIHAIFFAKEMPLEKTPA
jgi:hypothetical protein